MMNKSTSNIDFVINERTYHILIILDDKAYIRIYRYNVCFFHGLENIKLSLSDFEYNGSDDYIIRTELNNILKNTKHDKTRNDIKELLEGLENKNIYRHDFINGIVYNCMIPVPLIKTLKFEGVNE